MKTLQEILGVYETWDDKPGGKVVREYTEDEIDYVVVIFENSPGIEYTYFKADN